MGWKCFKNDQSQYQETSSNKRQPDILDLVEGNNVTGLDILVVRLLLEYFLH
jgi:hypothetical protein